MSQMLAFGRDGTLSRHEVDAAAAYVHALSNPSSASAAVADASKPLFEANCATCHGADAKGNRELGAPDLSDAFWTYGGDLPAIRASIWGGRQGQMPHWEARLSDIDRKILTLYVLDLGTPAP